MHVYCGCILASLPPPLTTPPPPSRYLGMPESMILYGIAPILSLFNGWLYVGWGAASDFALSGGDAAYYGPYVQPNSFAQRYNFVNRYADVVRIYQGDVPAGPFLERMAHPNWWRRVAWGSLAWAMDPNIDAPTKAQCCDKIYPSVDVAYFKADAFCVDIDAKAVSCPGRANSACFDDNRSCSKWAASGECDKSSGYMQKNCKKSCGICTYTAA